MQKPIKTGIHVRFFPITGMIMRPKVVLVVLLCMLSVSLNAMKIESSTCEYSKDPLGIEVSRPVLGWILSSTEKGDCQTAYEIRVASSRKQLKGTPDIWNTGKVLSDKSQLVPYSGKTLESGKSYYWQVRVWDKAGNPSSWSAIHTWSMALLNTSDWKGQWIGAIHQKDAYLPSGRIYPTSWLPEELASRWDKAAPLAKQSILLRRSFVLEKVPEEALIYISGLGHYDLYINGRQVDNSVFKPLWSDYDKTVYYNIFNVSEYLRKGENVIGVILGNGMYNLTGGRYTKFRVSFGPPTLMCQLRMHYRGGEDKEIRSDHAWQYAPGPITFNCISGGEDYDANLEQPGWSAPEFDASAWKPAVVQEAPQGKLTAQLTPAVKKMESYGVVAYKEVEPHTFVFNMGQNLSGFPSIKLKGKKGQKVRLILGEVLNSDSTKVEQGNSGSPYYFEYTLTGEGIEEWTPSFSYYGFQYIGVSGINYGSQSSQNDLPTVLDLTSHFVYLSVPDDGSFECSNPIFNQTHRIINRATRSNMQAVFTDCPHREKLGWLEETHLNAPGLLFNYNLRNVYPKVMQDISDAQLSNGLIPDIAPEYVQFDHGFRDSPEWGSAGVILPWMYYEWYGDDRLIKEYYPIMKKYADYLSSKADNYILSYGLGDWCDYGPHEAGVSRNTPIGITATGHYYMVANYTAKAARKLDLTKEAERYEALSSHIVEAFNTRLFNPETRQYGNGSQCSNALPLFLGIVPEQYKETVIQNLLEDIRKHNGKLTTGDVGNRYLYQALAMNDQNEVMYRMHNHREVPGYGFQIDLGVTTLTEQWNPYKGTSWNHFMMGQIDEWFYKSLAGILPDMSQPGFKHFFIKPAIAGDLTFVKSSYQSMYGLIRSEWEIKDHVLHMHIAVPVNTTATFIPPFGKREPVELGSGMHSFQYPVSH